MSEKVEVELLRRLEAITVEREKEREELNRLRRLVPNGTYTLNVAHEEEIQRLKDAGEVLIRSLERMTKERDDARATIGLIAKLQVAHGCDCDEMCANFDCERCFACKVSDALEESVAL